MREPFFPEIDAVLHEGTDSENPLAYRFYDAERSVLVKSMRDQLRFSVYSSPKRIPWARGIASDQFVVQVWRRM